MHSFINGVTASGKTHLAKSLAQTYLDADFGVLVLDPLNDPGWPCSRKFTDRDAFIALARKATGCVLFVDEAGITIGQYPPVEVEWLATQARHWGHRVYFVCQRAVQVKRTIRDQCSELYLFNVGRKDAEEWSENFNDDALRAAHTLPQYTFVHKRRFAPAELRKLKK